jgi:bifunctional non-homologous end joining protein LigD
MAIVSKKKIMVPASRLLKASGRLAATTDRKLSHFITPMLAQIHEQPFDDANWLFEIKWDGYRAIAEVKRNDIKLYSRNGLSFSQRYTPVATALSQLKVECILDGEIVAINKNNKPDFQKLQQYEINRSLPLVYYVFDCLSYKGKSIAHLPLIERKEILRKIIKPDNKVIRYSDHIVEDGVELFNMVTARDLEGIIAKRADSAYLPGKRTRDWLKIKNHNTQEAIIAGYTEPRGSRPYFGALILAIYENEKLRYVGHSGTGFSNQLLKQLYEMLQPLKINVTPFDEKIPINGKVTWVKPKLVCNVKYTELTADGIMRHPVFMGLRVDKAAIETKEIDKAVKRNVNGH